MHKLCPQSLCFPSTHPIMLHAPRWATRESQACGTSHREGQPAVSENPGARDRSCSGRGRHKAKGLAGCCTSAGVPTTVVASSAFQMIWRAVAKVPSGKWGHLVLQILEHGLGISVTDWLHWGFYTILEQNRQTCFIFYESTFFFLS